MRQAMWLFLAPSALCTIISFGFYIGYRFKCLITAQVAVSLGKPIARAEKAQFLVVAWIVFAAELLALSKIHIFLHFPQAPAYQLV